MSLDLRTRFDRDVVPVSARSFFGERLPAALEAGSALVATALRTRPLAPLAQLRSRVESGAAT